MACPMTKDVLLTDKQAEYFCIEIIGNIYENPELLCTSSWLQSNRYLNTKEELALSSVKSIQDKCRHKWRVNPGAFMRGCIGAICIKCGKRGCGCDVPKRKGEMPKAFWNRDGVTEIKNWLNSQ